MIPNNYRRYFSNLRHGVTYTAHGGISVTLNDDDGLHLCARVGDTLLQGYCPPGWLVDDALAEFEALTERAYAASAHLDAVRRVERVVRGTSKRRKGRVLRALDEWLDDGDLNDLTTERLEAMAYDLASVGHYAPLARRPVQDDSFVNVDLAPVHGKRRIERLPRELAPNKWDYTTSRYGEAARKRKAKRDAALLLELGAVVEAEAHYDWPLCDYAEAEIVRRQPWGEPWEDYVPLVGSREYSVANGEQTPSEWVGYYVPDWPVKDRFTNLWRSGMNKRDARNKAREGVEQEARQYLKGERYVISTTVLLGGEEWIDSADETDYEQFVDVDNPQAVLEFLADRVGIDGIAPKVLAELEELALGQVGPR